MSPHLTLSVVGCKTALILLSAQAQHADPQRYAKISSNVASSSGSQLHQKSRHWPTVWVVCKKWLGARRSFSELSDNERAFPKPPHCLPHLIKTLTVTVSTLGGETISCLLQWKGIFFFHPFSYWNLLRETARDELSQLKSLGLLNLVGWLAGQRYCNMKMTQPRSIFVGILLAAVETIISLLLNSLSVAWGTYVKNVTETE